MSITIHYRGSLTDKDQQMQLCNDLAKICSIMKWSIERVEPGGRDQEHPPVQGVFFLPHKNCEAVAFLFNDDGDLLHLSALAAYDPLLPMQKMVSVKTQHATPDVHIVIIKLLRYVRQKYIPTLSVNDEGEYWEQEDRDLLEHLFRLSDEKMNHPVSALDGASGQWRPSESGRLLLEKIDDILDALRRGDKNVTMRRQDRDITNWDVSLN